MSELTGKIISFINEVSYANGSVVSKALIKKQTGNVTLFAFDKGEKLSEHSAPFDALVQVIDGKAEILIDNKPFYLKAGDSIIMPANIPHALNATEQFKMLLTMIRG